MAEVLHEVRDGVGQLILNRPRAINALNLGMIRELIRVLESWADDPLVTRVRLTGAGDRGLCSGADVRQLREIVLAGGDPMPFFIDEYRLDQLIADYPKPYEAAMTGIVMGGGLGVSVHGSHRLVDTTSSLAMPETIIGLFPDVGMLGLLAAAGAVGTHLALSGSAIGGADAIRFGLADGWDGPPGDTDPGLDADWLERCYRGDDAGDILAALEGDEQEAAREAARLIRLRSPLSVTVTLAALRRAATMSLDEVFAQDLVLARFFVHHPDFSEGVRAQLVDKDRTPRWTHARIEDVTADEVAEAFA